MPIDSAKQATGLTDFVEQDLKARLLSGEGAPVKLTLAGISEHYGVSITPARLAVGNLVREGLIEKRDNGQLIPCAAPKRSVKTKTILPPPSAEDWDCVLLKEIMMASLEGEAVFLREEAMAQKFNVGRAGIRRTLGRLSSPGLLEHIPRCGWRVTPVDHERIRSYLQIRETLELISIEFACPCLLDEVLSDMLERCRDMDESTLRLDNSPHEYWIDKSGNFYIQAFFKQIAARYHTMLFHHAVPDISVSLEMAEQHGGILEALLSRDAELAKARLSEHIWTQERVLRDFLSQLAS